jgi:putative oxidoreductase
MKLISTVSRYLLGLVFVVFGLNGFLNFIPPQPLPAVAMQFFGSLVLSHYSVFVFGAQVVVGALLLANLFVPLALVILASIIVNIIAFHALMEPSGLPLAAFVTTLWVIVASSRRSAFVDMLQLRSNLPAR